METLYFEYQPDPSALPVKFFEVTTFNYGYITNFGKVGTPGQSNIYKFSNPSILCEQTNAIVQALKDKGYQQVPIEQKAYKAVPSPDLSIQVRQFEAFVQSDKTKPLLRHCAQMMKKEQEAIWMQDCVCFAGKLGYLFTVEAISQSSKWSVLLQAIHKEIDKAWQKHRDMYDFVPGF